MAYVYVQHAQCVLLFLVLVVNSDRFYIVTHSYSSRPFPCTLVIPGAYERREAALIVVHKLLVTLIYVTIFLHMQSLMELSLIFGFSAGPALGGGLQQVREERSTWSSLIPRPHYAPWGSGNETIRFN